MKRYRQAAILDLVTFEVIGSQDELRRQLRAKGFNATQATISRDIKELRLIKRSADGSYGKSTDLVGNRVHNATEVRRAVGDYLRSVDQVQQLLVLRTDAGLAQPLALAIDCAQLREVVGTVGGDDTVLVITRHARAGREVARLFEGWARV
jgi:transcriptional regulator of arginine metabolism